ncbi:hypothetical protein Dimus_004565 [Dionaea muscipula]
MAKRGRPRKIVVATSSGKQGSKTSVGGLGKKGSVGSDLNFISDAGLVVPSTDSQGVLEVQSNPKRWGQEEEVLIDNEVGVDPLLDPPYLRALTGADDLGRLDDDGLVVNALAGNRDMLDIRKVWRPKEVSQGGVSERMKSCEAILDKGKAIVQDRVMGASLNEGDWKTVSGKAPKGNQLASVGSSCQAPGSRFQLLAEDDTAPALGRDHDEIEKDVERQLALIAVLAPTIT